MRNRCLVDALRDRAQLAKRAAQPTYKRHVIVNSDLVVIERAKSSVILNRPLQVSCVILDIAKESMCRWHYLQMPQIFPRSILAYTDTGNLEHYYCIYTA